MIYSIISFILNIIGGVLLGGEFLLGKDRVDKIENVILNRVKHKPLNFDVINKQNKKLIQSEKNYNIYEMEVGGYSIDFKNPLETIEKIILNGVVLLSSLGFSYLIYLFFNEKLIHSITIWLCTLMFVFSYLYFAVEIHYNYSTAKTKILFSKFGNKFWLFYTLTLCFLFYLKDLISFSNKSSEIKKTILFVKVILIISWSYYYLLMPVRILNYFKIKYKLGAIGALIGFVLIIISGILSIKIN